MRFSTDEIKPFYEVRQNLFKVIDEVVHDNSEIVIAKHGKPVAALLSAENLYRYREVDRLMVQLAQLIDRQSITKKQDIDPQISAILDCLRPLMHSQ